MRELRVILVVFVALAVGGADARAQEQGVTVDPESPSGKEYAIPLETARRQADPRAASPSQAARAGSAALFGEGVGPSSGDGARSPGGNATGGSGGEAQRETRGSNPASGSRSDVPDAVSIAASRPAAPDGGIGMPMLVLGLGLLVVLIGVAAGVVIRRRAAA